MPTYTEEQKQKLKTRLSPEAYEITQVGFWKACRTDSSPFLTQNGGTERPFTGRYNNHYDQGLYKCIVVCLIIQRTHFQLKFEKLVRIASVP